MNEIFLIRRGSGELIHHWVRDGGDGAALPQSRSPGDVAGAAQPGNNRDTLVSGFLTAITAFAEEAFESDRESLRTLDLDDHRIYIRGGPSHLLAAKCSGTAPEAIEQLIDDAFIKVLAQHQAIEQQTQGLDADSATAQHAREHQRLLDELATELETGAGEKIAEMAPKSSFRLVKILLWCIALPLLAFAGWHLYMSMVTASLQRRADEALAGISSLSGYPVRVHVERGAQRMWVTGLVPDDVTRRALLGRLKGLAPTVALTPEVSVLPKSDVEARLSREGLHRALERARLRIGTLVVDLSASLQRLVRPEDRAAAQAALQAASSAQSLMPANNEALASEGKLFEGLSAVVNGLRDAGERVAKISGVQAEAGVVPPRDATEAADAAAHIADRLLILVTALEQRRNVAPLARSIKDVREQTVAVDRRASEAERRASEMERRASEQVAALDTRLEQRIADLERQLRAFGPKPETADAKLRAFVIRHAVFFENDTEYRDAAAAAGTLDALAALIRDTDLLIRVVGYTDEAGPATRNSPLSAARAQKVVGDLLARGVAPERLVAIGRLGGVNVAPDSGPGSSNRRVEFEIGYAGERRVRR